MADDIVIIKKYANRRLYNTETSSYVTLDDLYQMVKEGREFEVVDAKTRKDITQQVLTQIIFEEEARGGALLPINFLRQLIRYYDNSLQNLVPQYLEMTMDVFTQNQGRIHEKSEEFMKNFNPFEVVSLEEVQRRNMELIQKTFNMFNPMGFGTSSSEKPTSEAELLKAQIKELKAEIERLKQS